MLVGRRNKTGSYHEYPRCNSGILGSGVQAFTLITISTMTTVFDLNNLVETDELEFKAAQGQNGKGEVPRDFWETYSAFANTNGGTAILGIQENRDYSVNVLGIKDIQKVQKTIWDLLNDKTKISANLLSNKDVRVESVEGKNVLVITVPRATRHQRPIYTGTNPLTGTYRRNGEGDYKCDADAVKRMIAESQTDARDSEILEGFWLQDLEESSIVAYRNIFTSLRPNDEMSQLDNELFLYRLGVWNKDRLTEKKGLTLAGLLMFGKTRSIYDRLPHYKIDFFEYGENEIDWLDRVSNNDAGVGNLFNFYRRMYPKLVQDLKVPFELDEHQRRIDETSVHKALREALTNTVVHADYHGTVGISIKKFKDRFEFCNPGMSRFPINYSLYQGGRSDCRNPSLQKMFRFIGLGEQAGSGFPRIIAAWKEQHYYLPYFSDFPQPEYSLLRLPLLSLIADEVTQPLAKYFGRGYFVLPADARMTLAIAFSEGKVTNTRLQQVSESHSKDLTTLLQDLVQQGYLEAEGQRRGTYYHLPQSFNSDKLSANVQKSLPDLNESLPDLNESLPDLNESLPDLNESLPDLNENLPDLLVELQEIALTVRTNKKVSPQQMQQAIYTICQNQWFTTAQLCQLLGKTPRYLQNTFLSSMVKAQLLQLEFPDKPNHPQQRYKATHQPIEESNNFTLFS